MRGTLQGEQHFFNLLRFSPACAGNTPEPAFTIKGQAVQPRMCGEHIQDINQVQRNIGSAPHVRGTLSTQKGGTISGRFSPACAGNTFELNSGSA